jgi:hypothetical protein
MVAIFVVSIFGNGGQQGNALVMEPLQKLADRAFG